MEIDINMPVADIIKDNEKIKEQLVKLGFKALSNPVMVNTLAKKLSLKRGASMVGIKNLDYKLKSLGYKVIDSSMDEEIVHRRKLIKSYIKRLSDGEDLEALREDFKRNFSSVRASEIMDAEEELLSSGMDKKEVRKLCDLHSSLFHGMTENESSEKSYQKIPFLSYFSKENEKIKEILGKNPRKIKNLRNILMDHYKKKGDLIYPVLKAKYNKPGPSDVMWAVDIEILNNIKKAGKLKDETLLNESLERAREMTYKEENILYPLVFDNFTKEDFKILYEDLGDYDHDLVSYEVKEKSEPIKENGYIKFSKGRLSLGELEALLDTLEIEITFVNKDDINSYYNNPRDKKVFKRPKSSLGREVYSCHPPQLEPIVRGLIEDFKKGKKDKFKLVKTIKGTDYAIGYYAVRDSKGEYLGVLETVQDLSFYRSFLENNKI